LTTRATYCFFSITAPDEAITDGYMTTTRLIISTAIYGKYRIYTKWETDTKYTSTKVKCPSVEL
jgi:hypothetical protein